MSDRAIDLLREYVNATPYDIRKAAPSYHRRMLARLGEKTYDPAGRIRRYLATLAVIADYDHQAQNGEEVAR